MHSYYDDVDDTANDAAITGRFMRIDPDATSIYDLRPSPPPRYAGRSPARRRLIRDTRENLTRLREAMASGWDVGPELAHEEKYLAKLEAA